MTRKVAKTREEVVLEQSQAQRIVADEAIRDAFETVRDAYREAWGNTKPDEGDKREIAYAQFKAISDVWAELERRAAGGKVRGLQAAAAARGRAVCQGCGVSDGEKHLAGCAVLAAHLRTQALANG